LKLAGENSLERLKEKTLSVYENLAEEQE